MSAGTIPKTSGETRGEFNAFLKTVLRKVGDKATVVMTGNMRTSDGQYGGQIIVEVKHKGKLYDWGINIDSPNHRHLEEEYGTKSSKWRGKKAAVEVKQFKGFQPSIYFQGR